MNLRKASGSRIVLASVFAGLAAGLVAELAGRTSEAARERQQQAEARRKVADEDRDVQAQDVQAQDVPAQDVPAQESSGAADRALILREQEKLEATEPKRTNNVYAHSCRKVTLASYARKASNVDMAQCTPERLKLEQDVERLQNTMEQWKKP